MSKLKKLLAATSALLMCSGTVAYMPQDSSISEKNTAYAADDTAAESVLINTKNFPDKNFGMYVANQYDKNKDGALSAEEITNATEMNITSENISDLTGIEYLTELKYLDCRYTELTSFDISKNTALIELDCEDAALTSLDVSKNTALKRLYCDDNQLTSLDLSNNTALTELRCNKNQLTSLDLSKNTALETLYCSSNQLTFLDVSNNTALIYFYCGGNKLTSLDVSKNVELGWFSCSNNQLTSLDVSQNINLNELYCKNNQLTSLDLSNNKKIGLRDYSGNKYKIVLTNGTFDLSTLPAGFDLSKVIYYWTNGTVEGNILTVEDASKNVTYTYNCGNEVTVKFTLVPVSLYSLGDVNGNGAVDSSDASSVLETYALVSTGGNLNLTKEQQTAADVSRDSTIDASDASLILAYYAYIQTGGTDTFEEYLDS